MNHYPKARGLMGAWIHEQHSRTDLVGELARAVAAPGSNPPLQAFRQEAWQTWALAQGLTADHVEALFKEYARVPMDEKRAAYDASRAQRAQCVLQ